MGPQLFTIKRSAPGTLSTMARPRGGDELAEELEALRRAGVTVLVSLLSTKEQRELGLVFEGRAARESSLEFLDFPIDDRGVPQSKLDELVAVLAERLRSGANVAVHCRFGIGRSSMLAAAVMVCEGANQTAAWDAIATARSLPVPDTESQRAWVSDYANRLTSGPAPILEDDYTIAWDEWTASGDATAWDTATGDGLD